MSQSLPTSLLSDVTAISSETKKKNPELREVLEKLMEKLRWLREHPEVDVRKDLSSQADTISTLLATVNTRTPKVTPLAINCIQKLIAVTAIPEESINDILECLKEQISATTEIQLKILQTILPLLTNYPTVHGELLAEGLLICIQLQGIKDPIVTNTASATLRQIVIYLFEKVILEDATSQEGHTEVLPCAEDAYKVFQDLCAMISGDTPRFLKIDSLPRTLCLELIESVLSNHYNLFFKHLELRTCLQDTLCPMLIKTFSDKNDFSVTVRTFRVVQILLCRFNTILVMEGEIFLSMLLKLLDQQTPSWQRICVLEVFKNVTGNLDLIINIFQAYDRTDSATPIFQDMVATFWSVMSEKPGQIGVSFGRPMSAGVSADIGVSGSGSLLDDSANGSQEDLLGDLNMLGQYTSSAKIASLDQMEKNDPPAVPETYITWLALQNLLALCNTISSSPTVPLEMSILAWPTILTCLSHFLVAWLDEDLFGNVLKSLTNFLCNCTTDDQMILAREKFVATLCKSALPGFNDKLADTHPANMSIGNGMGTIFATGAGGASPFFYSDKNLMCLTALVQITQNFRLSLKSLWYVVLETMQYAEQILSGKTGGSGRCQVVKKLGVNSISSPMPVHGSGLRKQNSTLSDAAVSALKGAAGVSSGPPSASVPMSGGQGNGFFSIPEMDVQASMSRIQSVYDSSQDYDNETFGYFVQGLCQLSTDNLTTPELNGLQFGMNEKEPRSLLHLGLVPRYLTKSEEKIPGLIRVRECMNANMFRFLDPAPCQAWDVVTTYLVAGAISANASTVQRSQFCDILSEIVLTWMQKVDNSLLKSSEMLQKRILNCLWRMTAGKRRLSNAGTLKPGESVVSNFSSGLAAIECQRIGLETLTKILQTYGHYFASGWPTILGMIKSTIMTIMTVSAAVANRGEASTPIASPHPDSLPPAKVAALVRNAFGCLKLICTDYLSLLPMDCMKLCIEILGCFGSQKEELNISLTSVGLLWNVSDHLRTKRREGESMPVISSTELPNTDNTPERVTEEEMNPVLAIKSPNYFASEVTLQAEALDSLWMALLLQLAELCADLRSEVRNSANQTLFRTISIQGANLKSDTWDAVLWKIVFVLLDGMKYSGDQNAKAEEPLLRGTTEAESAKIVRDEAAEKQWDETRVLILGAVAKIFRDNLARLLECDGFDKAWSLLCRHLRYFFANGSQAVANASMIGLRTLVSTNQVSKTEPAKLDPTRMYFDFIAEDMEKSSKDKVVPLISGAWETWEKMGESVISRKGSTLYSQDTLIQSILALQDILVVQTTYSMADLGIYQRISTTLAGLIAYDKSKDFASDVEHLTTLQTAILDVYMTKFKLTTAGVPSLVLKALSSFTQLTFTIGALAELEPPQNKKRNMYGSPTYISLCDQCLRMAMEFWQQNKDMEDIYTSAFEELILALNLPLKLRYDCPNAQQCLGGDTILWKRAMNTLLLLIDQSLSCIAKLEDKQTITRCIDALITVIESALNSGSLPSSSQSEDNIMSADESLDLQLVEAITSKFLSQVAAMDIPTTQMIRTLTILRISSAYSESESPHELHPSLAPVSAPSHNPSVVKEKLAEGCLRSLFALCDQSNQASASAVTIAKMCAPILLSRCRQVLRSYIRDKPIYGKLPFPRIRTQELVTTLTCLCDLRLHHNIVTAPPNAPADTISFLHGPRGHLFQLYPDLIDCLAVYGASEVDMVTGLSVTSLLQRCLRGVGEALGVLHEGDQSPAHSVRSHSPS